MYCLRATRRIAGCAPARRILTRFLSRCALRRTKMTPGARSNWRRKFRTIPCLLIWIILRSSRGCLMLPDARVWTRAMRREDIAQKAHALLRIAPKKYGEGCTDLVMTLAQQGQFAPEDVWPYLR